MLNDQAAPGWASLFWKCWAFLDSFGLRVIMDKHELKKNLDEIADNVKVSDLQEETKLSRLFYLQLYSSVLNAEKQNKRREKLLKRKKLISDAKKKVIDGWMDLGKILCSTQ